MAIRSSPVAVACGLAVTLALSACSGIDPLATAPTAPPIDSNDSNETGDEPEQLAFVSDDDASVLRLALPQVSSWDPALVDLGNQAQVVISDLMYDGLTEASADGELRAGLATSWTSNETFTEWTFVLDTERIGAQETVDSFNRMLATPSLAAELLAGVEAVDAVGETEVRFVLRDPDAGLPWLLSGLPFSVVTGDGTDGDSGFTGRFTLAEASGGVDLVDDQGLEIQIRWSPDGDGAYSALTLNQVDAAVVTPALTADAASRFGVEPSARSVVRFYGLNLASENLWDPMVREAILASVDRPGMLEKLPMAAYAADGVSGPSSAGFSIGACGTACVYDPAGAATILSDVDKWPTLTIAYVGGDQNPVAQVMADGLIDAGFEAELVEVGAEELRVMIADGTADIFSFGWAAPAGSLDAVAPVLFASDSSLNVTGLVSPEVDALLSQAAQTADDAERWELLAEAERVALSESVLAPIAVGRDSLVQSPAFTKIETRPDGSIDTASLG